MGTTTADGNTPTGTESEGMGTLTKLGLGAAAAGAGYLLVTGKGGSFLEGLKDVLTSKGMEGVIDLGQKAAALGTYLGLDPKILMAADGAQFVKDAVKNGIQKDNVGQLIGAAERWATTEFIENSLGWPPFVAAAIGQAVKWGLDGINQSIGAGAVGLMKNANIGKLLNPQGGSEAAPSAPPAVVAAAGTGAGRSASNS